MIYYYRQLLWDLWSIFNLILAKNSDFEGLEKLCMAEV